MNTPISVVANDDGIPLRIQVLGQWRDVEYIANVWRQNMYWWDKELAVNRELYKVTTRDGMLVVVYRNLDTDTWCLQRIWD